MDETYYYAQLDENNICMGISALSGAISLPHMIEITEEEYANSHLLGKKYDNGEWLDI